MQLQQRSLKKTTIAENVMRIISLLNFHPLQGDLCFHATFQQLLKFFLSLMQIVYSVTL